MGLNLVNFFQQFAKCILIQTFNGGNKFSLMRFKGMTFDLKELDNLNLTKGFLKFILYLITS